MYPYVQGGTEYVNVYMNLCISRFLTYKKEDYPVIPIVQAFYDSDESDYVNPTGHLGEMYEVFEDHELVSNGLAFYAWRPGGNKRGIRADTFLRDEVQELISLNEGVLPGTSVAIYPNPCNFREDQRVRITNLSSGAEVVVRIFDLAGNLVRTLQENNEVTLEGYSKTVTWDGVNEVGQNVARGVYLVFVTDEEGTRFIGKIAVVNK
ncbi:T9SS type A sorting domain-containing protein [Candidatus Aerophobetes bacterium]|uniref:T9SS type A sorting domain-containing protein n=1 Tax=Aerophobetes bacterium TaxID=2030807 RepID=A0A523QHM0_UNCAE|nr:MAG: T9SS type A sorting domain-containing protein [Candidatus Aerophobetes bacterium]